MGDINYVDDFDYYEFACKCGRCGVSGRNMKLDIVIALQVVRTLLNRPLVVTSGMRCPAHNKAVGGKDDSEHLTGEGADVEVLNSRDRYELFKLLVVNFDRIGIGDTFIHVGISKTKTQGVVWTY